MKPAKHVYSKDFKYTKAVETDLKRTFARIRREQQKAQESVVRPIRKQS